jgi:hypothetical protein
MNKVDLGCSATSGQLGVSLLALVAPSTYLWFEVIEPGALGLLLPIVACLVVAPLAAACSVVSIFSNRSIGWRAWFLVAALGNGLLFVLVASALLTGYSSSR